jgi:DNA modification methylase
MDTRCPRRLDGYPEEDDEKHVCPLQLEVIRRLVKLYSNAGEMVLDPFMGIGSTGFVAVEQGRKAVGFEIKESYHRQAVRNIAKATRSDHTGQIKFDGELSGVTDVVPLKLEKEAAHDD